ncbi:hypothetical protein [Lactococcus lactis]|uniref:hypothetical protein n=1 Tax=Lactococcus lactis TaxID=1358 RepID=UPI0024A99CDE|nr:hypothetical protein [Lactococcus lactis]
MKIEIDGIEYLTNEQAKEVLGFKSNANQVSKLLKKYIEPLKLGATPFWEKSKIEDYKNGKFTTRRIKRQNIEFNGINYKSVKEMAAELGLSETQCSNYLRLKELEK